MLRTDEGKYEKKDRRKTNNWLKDFSTRTKISSVTFKSKDFFNVGGGETGNKNKNSPAKAEIIFQKSSIEVKSASLEN